MKNLLVLSIVILWAHSLSFAKNKPYFQQEAPVTVEMGSAKRLFISAFSGQVSVLPGTGTTVTVRYSKYIDYEDGPGSNPQEILKNAALRVQNTGDVIEVKSLASQNKTDWNQWAQNKNAPQFKVEISAPTSLALEIYWARGDVKVALWNSSVTLTHQSGRVTLENINGDVILRTLTSSVKLANIKGQVSHEIFTGQTLIENITGKLRSRTFSGETRIKKVEGALWVSSQKAVVSTQDTSGGLEVVSGAAAIKVLDHKGALKGNIGTGSLDAKLLAVTSVDLNSLTGAMRVSVPRASGAHVYLATQKGTVKAPQPIESKKVGTERIIQGKLSGKAPGSIKMSSEASDILLRTF